LTCHLSGSGTCFKTVEAEKTGVWELRIWIPSLIEEKGSAGKTVGERSFKAASLQASSTVVGP